MYENGSLSTLQRQELEIFCVFKNICEKYHLRYYAVAGTMLGAVRHNGFIPWDDDIDVAMPRKDYEKFLKIAPQQLPNEYFIGTPREKEHIWIVSMIISKKNDFTLNNALKVRETGAWIDIMVIDGIPNPGIRRIIHWNHYMILRALYQISHFEEIVDQNRKRPWYERIIIYTAKITRMQRLLNPVKINTRIEKLMRKYDYDSSEYVAANGIYRKKEIVPKDWYGNGKEYAFENIILTGLAKADKYLTQLYGDYMIPPSNISISRHNVKEK